MDSIVIKQHPAVKVKFDAYPEAVKAKMNNLRELILASASAIEHIQEIEETLKWGEPSYKVKKGSPIRMDWKAKNPDQYAMYFNCSTSLMETFKMVFGDVFKYEKNRAILFDLQEKIPQKELQECIEMALQYHLLKDKPLLRK
ncbi:MAG: DUF1801 domain-containing protein [Bacteroidota bacterium]